MSRHQRSARAPQGWWLEILRSKRGPAKSRWKQRHCIVFSVVSHSTVPTHHEVRAQTEARKTDTDSDKTTVQKERNQEPAKSTVWRRTKTVWAVPVGWGWVRTNGVT
jgi:hypothetical protein